MIKKLFSRTVATPPAPVKLWPSNLNPCPTPEAHMARGVKAPCWGVKGKTTKVCLWCVVENADDKNIDRQIYLDTLNPDMTGSDSQL